MKTIRIFGLAIFFGMVQVAGAVYAAQAEARLEFTLKPEATVEARYFTLVDVAEIRATTPEVASALQGLRVGSAPRVGYVEQFARDEIVRTVRQRLLPLQVQIEADGSSAVKLRSIGRPADLQAIADFAHSYLHGLLKGRFNDVEVSLAAPVADFELPAGNVAYKARPIDVEHMALRVPLWVDILVNNVPYRSVVLPFVVQVRRTVFIARQTLPQGAQVSIADFDVKENEPTAASADFSSLEEGAVPSRLRRPINAGQVLTRAHLPSLAGVAKGDLVKLVVAEGAVSIETVAIAYQDADIGQSVKVKAERSSDTIMGRLVSSGIVVAEKR